MMLIKLLDIEMLTSYNRYLEQFDYIDYNYVVL